MVNTSWRSNYKYKMEEVKVKSKVIFTFLQEKHQVSDPLSIFSLSSATYMIVSTIQFLNLTKKNIFRQRLNSLIYNASVLLDRFITRKDDANFT